jgi:hypothetical protein
MLLPVYKEFQVDIIQVSSPKFRYVFLVSLNVATLSQFSFLGPTILNTQVLEVTKFLHLCLDCLVGIAYLASSYASVKDGLRTERIGLDTQWMHYTAFCRKDSSAEIQGFEFWY